MPADIFGSRFYGHRVPAWHRVGQVSTDRISAVEALRRVGSYNVVLEPTPEPGSLGIIRAETADDPHRRSFGKVDSEYVLVPPDELTTLWDENVHRPVETLGVLQRGACLFVTLLIDTYEVRGDGVRTYLVFAHWMTSQRVSTAFLTPVRVVCSNTLHAAQHLARGRLEFRPTADIQARIAMYLRLAMLRCRGQSFQVRKQFEAMADYAVRQSDAELMVAAAYPGDDAELRRAALELFAGAGTGLDHPAARGTLWGLYNAIAELENFRVGGSDEEVAEDVLFGTRAATMQRAFRAAVELCAGREPVGPPPFSPSGSRPVLVR